MKYLIISKNRIKDIISCLDQTGCHSWDPSYTSQNVLSRVNPGYYCSQISIYNQLYTLSIINSVHTNLFQKIDDIQDQYNILGNLGKNMLFLANIFIFFTICIACSRWKITFIAANKQHKRSDMAYRRIFFVNSHALFTIERPCPKELLSPAENETIEQDQ